MGKLTTALLVIFTMMLASANAQQEPNDGSGDIRYITDDLYTFIHSGPGRDYRILGSVMAGSRVSVLQEDKQTGFIEIIDDKQRTGWVDAKLIVSQRSVRELVPSLQQSLQQAKEQLTQEQQNDDLLNQQLSDINSRNALLLKDLASLKKDNERIQRELDAQDQSEQMQWLTRGGIIAVVGMLLGVIIAYLPKKRRRNDQWM
ncbi:TIGR04211 family SH3 domain-containing protein [Aliiglaciecola sp. LCG003]|uniref:TIGR04211 family SH3 domain-containing protein n=1 Tax=Aliiglaciecola sp. LCG003 TaxID=3053655 RepID=UPI0025736CC6|nr:TIGR04211 family SH3 domain-containing protein [Aliiglaciecola sp. LCG003]WJG09035.1 TIGR04211 family SH3 domain-containing protein [Aliiglaciecola sp. LCG003]